MIQTKWNMSQKILAVVLMCLTCISAHGPPGVPPRQGGGPPAGMPQQQQQFNQQQPPQYQQQPPPPNHQQQPPPPNQQQQPPQQQPPQQQAYDPHANVVEGHGPDKAFKFQSEIHNADHILEHLQDTIKTKPREQMTEEELEFHYFKMHDYDNNNKLDGVEIGKALTHFHEDKEEQPPQQVHDPPSPDSKNNSDQAAGTKPDSNTETDPYEQTGTAETPDNPHLPPTPAVNTNPDQAADSADFMNASSESAPDFKAQKIYNDGELAAVVDFILLQMDQNENGYVEYFEYRTFQDNFKKTEKSEPRG